jgi:hypothetical protein
VVALPCRVAGEGVGGTALSGGGRGRWWHCLVGWWERAVGPGPGQGSLMETI